MCNRAVGPVPAYSLLQELVAFASGSVKLLEMHIAETIRITHRSHSSSFLTTPIHQTPHRLAQPFGRTNMSSDGLTYTFTKGIRVGACVSPFPST